MRNENDQSGISPAACGCLYYTDVTFSTEFPCSEMHTSILHINIRSLMKNFNAFVSFMNSIDNYQFTFIAITETWLNDLSPFNTLQIDGYKLLYKNRSNKRGGGVALFIKENFHANIRADLSELMNDSAETLFVEVENSKIRNTVVGVIYRPLNKM